MYSIYVNSTILTFLSNYTITLVCEDDADLTFLSSDGVEFKIHSASLNIWTSKGFARESSDTLGDPQAIQLEELAEVLEIIFQFIEPPTNARDYKHPSVFDLDPQIFFKVAEAAEKYVIYGATRVCVDRMKLIVSNYPAEVLNHCTLHGYPELGDQACDTSLSYPITEIIEKLTAPGLLTRYLIYYQKWRDAGQQAAKFISSFSETCPRIAQAYREYRLQVDQDPLSVINLPDFHGNLSCGYNANRCYCSFDRESVAVRVNALTIGIPKFNKIRV
ncbi:hypothetical protein BDN70DRAFT_861921 [Pholiota conissans]|uniref:BTB domain-containing protein n=1 Tax=Pholiota conissans TaxID=109636 RepID=A0A9P5YYA8_9AGAR|nr:hypothetical protein BDN70DRAFT_861921 [Pholiota conissans]